MDPSAVRYRVTATLLEAAAPLTLDELVREANLSRQAVLGALFTLVDERVVLEDQLDPGRPGPQYAWAARWGGKARPAAKERPDRPELTSDVVGAFTDFVTGEYVPPADKRFLVFFQCAVRRPFSKAPSHASMRRAVAAATGHDPAREFAACPVHVVVLASTIGPVPYELEDLYPANVRGGGVRHMGNEEYARARPVLAERMAAYLTAHGRRYERVAAFCQGRYGEVIADAARAAGREFPVFPAPGGPTIRTLAGKTPRSYWERCWIQLTLEILSWLGAAERAAAMERLAEHGAVWDD